MYFHLSCNRKGKGNVRIHCKHEKGQIDIQNPDWIISWSWLNWLVCSSGGKRGNRCEWLITFCQKIIFTYLNKKKYFQKTVPCLSLTFWCICVLLNKICPYHNAVKSFMCHVCFIWTSFHQCFQICLHKTLQYSLCDLKKNCLLQLLCWWKHNQFVREAYWLNLPTLTRHHSIHLHELFTTGDPERE